VRARLTCRSSRWAASEFVEAIVGVGAARVRDLFAQAKEAAPAIVFIDELDAIGRSRTRRRGFSGGNDEREQTLNQILTEMDGFDSSTGVIVIAATNRPDVLDQACCARAASTAASRCSRPTATGREAILEVHTRGVPLGPDVDLAAIAATTPGWSAPTSPTCVNEAALLAAAESTTGRGADFTDRARADRARRRAAGDDERGGPPPHRLPRGRPRDGRHAHPGADPVRKISIIPRGVALGVTFSAPDADRFNYEYRELLARIDVAWAAASPRRSCSTTSPRRGVGHPAADRDHAPHGRPLGHVEAIGPLAVIARDGAAGPLFPGVSEVSEQTQQLVDSEVRRIVDEAHERVVRLLTSERGKLDSLAGALLEHETLDEDAAYAAAGVAHEKSRRVAAGRRPGRNRRSHLRRSRSEPRLTRVLVTGAYGCIGSWVTRDLVGRGIDVIAYDLGDDPRRMALIMDAPELARVTHVHGDIIDLEALEAVIDNERITNIIHLAALQVPFCRADPPLGARVNVVGTVNVLEAVARRLDRIGPVVYASSIAAYDAIDAGDGPAMSGTPGTIYGVYKRANEGSAWVYHEERGVGQHRPAATHRLRPRPRPGPDLGADQRDAGGRGGRKFKIPYGGTSQFQYAPDVARAFVQAALAGYDGASVHNLAGQAVSMEGVVSAIQAAAPEAGGLISYDDVTLPFPEAVDAASLTEVIGPVEELPFQEGVADAVDRFRRLLADGRVAA
jgi:nucleoside-diphosphate-sugar epimerase